DFRSMSALSQAFNFVVPSPLRRPFRAFHRDFVFQNAMRQFVRTPEILLERESNVLTDLMYGCGDEGWAAQEEYLIACLRNALCTKGNILECGSGLTTILLGVVAQQNGRCL